MPPPEYNEGFWGKPTATIDWCEKNYEVNYYVAEWWNTVSNLAIFLPPLWGIYEVYKHGLEKRFMVCNFWLFTVGCGSWAFHMTLLYEMQLFDELPMIYWSLSLLYFLHEAPKPENQNYLSNKPLFFSLTVFAVVFTLMYLVWPQPWFQHGSYAVIMLWSYWLGVKIISQKKCKICKRIFILSLGFSLFAFFLWNMDKVFCSSLNEFRANALYGVGPLTQLHAWWHALAGYSSYLQILFCIHSWYDFHKGKEEKRKLTLMHFGFSLRWL